MCSSDEDSLSQEQSRCTAMHSTSHSSRGLCVAMLSTGEEGPPENMDIETPPTSPETPPTSPECGHSNSNRTKATEWIRQVSIESNQSNQYNQSCVSESMKTPVESGKKGRGKYFVVGGLAERMQRIIQRENSEITFWEHHLTTQQETGIVLLCHLCVNG